MSAHRLLALAATVAIAAAGCGAAHGADARPPGPVPVTGADPVTSTDPPTTPPTTQAVTTTRATPAPTTTTVAPGPPYPLAAATLRMVDSSRPTVSHGRTVSASRSLTTLVWYPDRPGRWPLLVFAHGFQVGPTPYIPLLEAWAAHGYVVAAPEFPLTDQAVAGADLDEADINQQPADVRFVTDEMVSAASPLAAYIDVGRVGVAGHSDGAETALAASTDPVPAGEPRFRAVMVLSGQPVDGAAGRNPPALVAQGDADAINPPSFGYATYQQAAAPRYLLVMEGAGHLPAYEPGQPWYPGVVAVTEAFLDAYLAVDRPATAVPAAAAPYADLSLRSG